MTKITFKNGNVMKFDPLPDDQKPIATTPYGKYFNVLETHYMIDLPTESNELAQLIYSNSYDWAVCLDFIDSVSKSRGIIINKREVAEKIRELLGIGL